MTTPAFKDYYAILGVNRDASGQEIKRAYRELAQRYHPDLDPGNVEFEARFKEINEAYSVLSHPDERQRYDSLDSDQEQHYRRVDRPMTTRDDVSHLREAALHQRPSRRARRGGAISVRISLDLGPAEALLGGLDRLLGEVDRRSGR